MGTLSDIRDAVAAGEPVDWDRVRRLQDLDFVLLGQQVAAESRARTEAADDAMAEMMAASLNVEVPPWLDRSDASE